MRVCSLVVLGIVYESLGAFGNVWECLEEFGSA